MDVGDLLENRSKLAKRIEDLTLELVGVRSVVGTSDEIDISNRVFNIFKDQPYWQSHPEDLLQVPFVNDPLGRSSVVATLSGNKSRSAKTVILIGHIDTVGVSDYGDFRELATEPKKLVKALKELLLSDDARADLESGNYLFGRGILDMKCGVAIIMALMEEMAKELDEWSGNLIFAAVGDEEGNSGGMLSVVPELVRLQSLNGFEYLGVIDTDYTAPRYDGDDHRYIYIGTVGKLMPTFYVVGKETHVGQPFNGLDPTQIAGAIINKINKNIAYSDVADGEVSLPPITLHHRDLKEEYSVQIARTACLYFNYATHKSTPDEVMAKMIRAGQEAFSDVVNTLNERYDIFCKASHIEPQLLPWKARVISYQELYEMVKAERGQDVDERLEAIKAELLRDESLDERYFSQKLVEEVHSMWSDKDPVVVVYFSPPYYPHNYVTGKNEKETHLLNAVELASKKQRLKYPIVNRKFYPYISDLSYASAPSDRRIEALENNMPAFGSRYKLPIQDMQLLNLPVVNIGPYGKDAHQFTERIEKHYSFKVAPILVYDTLMNLLGE